MTEKTIFIGGQSVAVEEKNGVNYIKENVQIDGVDVKEGSIYLNKFGRSNAVGTTEEIIWDGGNGYEFIEKEKDVEIFSSDVNDKFLGGTGLKDVYVQGINKYGELTQERVELNGTTPVQLTNKFKRVFRMRGSEGNGAAIGGGNIGTITLRTVTDNEVLAQILPNESQTLMLIYTIPHNYSGYLLNGSLYSGGRLREIKVNFKTRNGVGGKTTFSTKFVADAYENPIQKKFDVGQKIEGGTDLFVSAINLSSGDVALSGDFEIILIPETIEEVEDGKTTENATLDITTGNYNIYRSICQKSVEKIIDSTDSYTIVDAGTNFDISLQSNDKDALHDIQEKIVLGKTAGFNVIDSTSGEYRYGTYMNSEIVEVTPGTLYELLIQINK